MWFFLCHCRPQNVLSSLSRSAFPQVAVLPAVFHFFFFLVFRFGNFAIYETKNEFISREKSFKIFEFFFPRELSEKLLEHDSGVKLGWN